MTNIKITLILPYIFKLIEAQPLEQYLKGALCLLGRNVCFN